MVFIVEKIQSHSTNTELSTFFYQSLQYLLFFFQNKVVANPFDKWVLSHLTNEAEVMSIRATAAISLAPVSASQV